MMISRFRALSALLPILLGSWLSAADAAQDSNRSLSLFGDAGIPAWEDMVDGRIAFMQRKYDRAIGYFKQYLERQPGDPETYRLLLLAATMQHDSTQARALLTAARAQKAPEAILTESEAYLLFLNGQTGSLASLAEKAPAKAGGSLLVRVALALAGFQKEDSAILDGQLNALRAADPDFPLLKLVETLVFTRNGQHAQSAEALQRALLGLTGTSEVREAQIQILGIDSLMADAAKKLKVAADGDSKDVPLLLNYGFILYYLGRFADSDKVFDRILTLEPRNKVAILQHGIFLVLRRDYAASVKVFRDYLTLDPDNLRGRKLLGASLGLAGEVEEAVAAFQSITVPGAKDAEVWTNLGVFLLSQNKQEEAREAYEKAIAAQPEYSDARRNLGIFLTRTGRVSEGMAQFEKTVQLNPLDGEAAKYIGLIHYDEGDPIGARRWLARADTIIPGDPGVTVGIAACELAQGNPEEGLRLINPILEEHPDTPEALITRARIFEAMHKPRLARIDAQKVISLNPDNKDAQTLLKGLETQLGKETSTKAQITFVTFTNSTEAAEFLSQVRTGKDFKAAAGKNPVSNVSVEPGSILQEVEEAAFSLGVGKISEVVSVGKLHFVIKRLS